MTNGLLLVGAGGHARSCIEVIESTNIYRIAGLIGQPNETGNSELGYKVIGQDDDIAQLVELYSHALVSVGQIKSATLRVKLFNLIQQCGYVSPTIVASSARVSKHAVIGAGSIVMHGAIVNAGATIGVNCIINSRSVIEHDVQIGDHSHVSVGAILNGGATVSNETFIGSGALIKEGLNIGARCVIGMGVVVRRDVESESQVAGVGINE
jgi:sugar O-acyltransferase (sialic acid O-acetyltransferase NeuD family)